jgi:hypothetical protein
MSLEEMPMSEEQGDALSVGDVTDRVNQITSVHKREGAMNDDQRASRPRRGKGGRKEHPST